MFARRFHFPARCTACDRSSPTNFSLSFVLMRRVIIVEQVSTACGSGGGSFKLTPTASTGGTDLLMRRRIGEAQ